MQTRRRSMHRKIVEDAPAKEIRPDGLVRKRTLVVVPGFFLQQGQRPGALNQGVDHLRIRVTGENFVEQQFDETYFYFIGLVVHHQARYFRENLTAKLDGEFSADIGRNTRQLLSLPPDNTLHEFGNGFPLRILEVVRTEIRDSGDEERSPEVFAALDPAFKGIQYFSFAAPFITVGQPDSDSVCWRVLDTQKDELVIINRIPQPFTHGGSIQHRVSSRQNAGTLAVKLSDEVPQCTPCAYVSPTVGEFVEAIDRQLNGAAPDEWFQLLLEEAGAQA